MAAGTRKHGSGAGRGPGSLWFTDSGLGRWAYRGVSGRKSRSGARVRSWGRTPGAEEHLAAASALLPVLSSASDPRGRDPKTAGGQAGRQVGASVQPAREGRFGAREEPALNSQVLTGTLLRRHQHPREARTWGCQPLRVICLSQGPLPASGDSCLLLLEASPSVTEPCRPCPAEKKILCLVQSKLL